MSAKGFQDNLTWVTPVSLQRIDVSDLRFMSLIFAMLLYGFSGSPTPDDIGWVEWLIGGFLFMSVGIAPAAMNMWGGFHFRSWHGMARLLCCYGLTVPIMVGIINGHYVSNMVRDVVPFLFLLLPLWLAPLIGKKSKYLPIYTAAAVFIGVMFAARVFAPYMLEGSFRAMFVRPEDPLYLGNAPTVLFAAMVTLGLAGQLVYRNVSLHSWVKGLVLLALSILPLMAMALIIQRASIGMTCLMVVLLTGYAFLHRPVRVLPILFVLAVMAVLAAPILMDVLQSALHKTSLVGFNMRWQEMRAVFDMLDGSLSHLLWGHGWGATFASPAVGGEVVNFTHSMVTTFLLKSGLIGVLLVFSYLFLLALPLARLIFSHPVITLALGSVLIIDVFLYASFKSFDFGVVLVLIPLWVNRSVRLRESRALV